MHARPLIFGSSLLLLVGCHKMADDSSDPPPDVTGRYNVSVDGASGCQDEYRYWTLWAQGPLQISGTSAGDLTFDFYDGMDFSGLVDNTWTFEFGGDKDWVDGDITATLSVSARGSFTTVDGDNVATSDTLEILVDDDGIQSNNCTVSAKITATEL